MAETYPINPPSSGIAKVKFLANTAVSVSQSPFSFSQQVYKHQGMRWEADITLPPMKRADAETWASFLLRLRGQYGTFLLGDPAAATPRGSAATTPGTPLVKGGSQTGENLIIDGCPTSVNGYLKAGDYIQLGSSATARLYKVLEDVNTNASGEATLNIYPNLRSSPDDNANVTVSNARGLFRLSGNDVSWDVNEASIYGITFGAIEAL